MKEITISKVLLLIVILLLCSMTSSGQDKDKKSYPSDSLWIFISIPDTIRSDSLPYRGSRTSDLSFDAKIPEFQYKSPEASAFKKYGDYHTNEYTGNADIRVPLYTVSYKDIEIPIELTYDASGIKVDQEASWVGLGWNLMAGGCINYVSSGSVDPRTFYASQASWESFLATGSGDLHHFTTGFTGDNSDLGLDVKNGHGERDYYSANFLGRSFLFSFNPFTDAITVIGRDSERYKVEVDNGCSYQQLDNAVWKVTDGDGYQYYFSPGERTNAFVTGGVYTSTWNLTQIVSPEGSIADLTYCNAISINYRPFRGEQYDIMSGNTNTGYYPTPGYSAQMTQTNVSVQTRYLTSIETRDQRISFTLDDRTDIVNAKRLNKISVYSKISQQTLKEYTFSYGYFTGSTVGGNSLNDQSPVTYTDDLKYRLKLNSVTESAGTTSLTTSFAYNETVSLPLKTSCAKDFWGYFNNKENMGSSPIASPHTLLPTPLPLFINSGVQLTETLRTLKGANRYCDSTYMQAAMLTKITYPTKGYTTFAYEPNKFVSSTRYPTTSEYAANVINESLLDSNSPNQTVNKQLNLTQNAYGMIKVTFSGSLQNLKNAGASVSIIPLNPNIGTTLTYNLSLAPESEIVNGSFFTKSLPVDLLATSYMMVVNCPNSLGTTGYYVSATLNVTQAFTASNVPVSTGGGLRIQSIGNYNHDGSLQYRTDYEYTDASGNCTGKLLMPLSFSESWQIICAYQVPGCSDPGCILTYTYALQRLIIPSTDCPVFFYSLAGGVVGYSTVRKKTYSGSGSLLSTVTTTYTNNQPQYAWNIHYFNNDNNGSIITQSISDPTSGTIKCKRFNYSNEVQNNRCNAIVYDRVRDFTDWGFDLESPYTGRYDVRIYPFYVSWKKLNSITETTYNGNDSLSVTKEYMYNSQNHKVKSETENSSDSNITYMTEYKYPFDFSSSPYTMMCDNTYFMINTVIEKSLSVFENGTKKQVKKRSDSYTGYTNKYRDGTDNSRVFLPTSSYFALNGDTMEKRLDYSYNSQCDKTSITKDSEKVAYLWAYNYMYPVAEIKGATHTDLSNWGLSTYINNLTTKTTTSEVSALLNTIRSSLASRPVLMISYTYEPLIGITGMTAPNGTVSTYTYDALGRLSNVKNHGNSIIQQNSYNYKQ